MVCWRLRVVRSHITYTSYHRLGNLQGKRYARHFFYIFFTDLSLWTFYVGCGNAV